MIEIQQAIELGIAKLVITILRIFWDFLEFTLINSAIIVSICALAFTIISFWWMNWRTGKLHISGPRSYAAKGSIDGRMILRIPFVFFNDGPTPIVIQNMRLVFLNEAEPNPLRFVATVTELLTSETPHRALATQFVVHGREAILLICEFQRDPGCMLFEARSYPFELQALLGDRKDWMGINKFSLNVSEKSLKSINSVFTAYDNMK